MHDRRVSVVVRIAIVTAIALLGTFWAIAQLNRTMLERGMQAGQAGTVRHLARLVAAELERAATPSGAIPAGRLHELERLHHVQLTWHAWSDPHPRELDRRRILRLRGFPPRAWIRLGREGAPVGAVEMRFDDPRIVPGLPRPFRRAMPVVLGLLIVLVPPLVVWVVRPLKESVAVAHRLADGDLEAPVPVRRRDEFGDLERALETLRQRILRMLGDKDRLLSDLSHELRGPLSRMSVAIALLERQGQGGTVTDALKRDLREMDVLLEEWLTWSRVRHAGVAHREPLDLADLAREALEARRLAAGEARLAFTLHPSAAPVRGDARLLERALGNLVDNALKYADRDSVVTVETFREAGASWFRIRNEGPGLEPMQIARVFEPFTRPDGARSRQTGGSGLGLAIVEAIVREHGGEATMTSSPQGPTTVTLRFG